MSERLVMDVQTGKLEVIPLTPEEIVELQPIDSNEAPNDVLPAE
jgi:hypothetical protein